MSTMLEMTNSDGKLVVSDDIPCFQLLRTVNGSNFTKDSSITYTDMYSFTTTAGKVFAVGFDLSTLANGTYSYRLGTSQAGTGTCYVYIESKNGSALMSSTKFYLFGVPASTEASTHLEGIEIYDSEGSVVYTSNSNTKYLKVVGTYRGDTHTLNIDQSPYLFVFTGWDIVAGEPSKRRFPSITKSGKTVTVNKWTDTNDWPLTYTNLNNYGFLICTLANN